MLLGGNSARNSTNNCAKNTWHSVQIVYSASVVDIYEPGQDRLENTNSLWSTKIVKTFSLNCFQSGLEPNL